MKDILKYTVSIVLLVGVYQSYAQSEDIYEKYDIYRNPVMVFVNKFSLTLTTGYGATTFKHDLEGVYFYQDQNAQYIFNNNTEAIGQYFTGYSNWLNDPSVGEVISADNPYDLPYDYLPNPVNNPLLQDQSMLVNTDTAELGFKGVASSIPVTFSVHYNYQEFRFGLGFMYEKQFINTLKPTNYDGVIRDYQPNFSSTSYTRFFGMAGYRFYQYWNWDMVAEVQLGSVSYGKAFNQSTLNSGMYTNIGVSFENVWSEYFRLIFKPSLDFKSYTINTPDGASVQHSNPTFFMQFGVSINIPEIPRSPLKSDHTQLKHVYTDPVTGRRMEVRGQPITKRQNPKVGENHRKLWRYKKKNKNKLNPY